MAKRVRLLRKDGQPLFVVPELVTKVDSTAEPGLSLIITSDSPRAVFVRGTADEVNTLLEQGARPPGPGWAKRVSYALEIANRSGGVDGDHHKAWAIDQMVRALTGCPFSRTGPRLINQGTSTEYGDWVNAHNAGEEGPNTYAWSTGTPP